MSSGFEGCAGSTVGECERGERETKGAAEVAGSGGGWMGEFRV